MMGSSEILPTELEIKMKTTARRSIVALEDIDIGETFNEKNIGLRRPGNGLPPKMFEKLLGKKANKNYEIGDKIGIITKINVSNSHVICNKFCHWKTIFSIFDCWI